MAIQEHRICKKEGDGTIIHKHIGGGWQLIYSPADTNGVGGVGILCSRGAYAMLNSAVSLSSRLLKASFTNNTANTHNKLCSFPDTVVFSCYSPTNVSLETERLEFFNFLNNSIEEVSEHSFLVCCGDFNARLGSDRHRGAIATVNNENGELLQDVLDAH